MSELNFQSLIEDLKNDPSGAIIMITGSPGCGKTTLAMMIYLEIVQSRTIIVREDCLFPKELRREDLELSLKTGKVIICTASDEYHFCKDYGDGSITKKVHAKTIRIKFDDSKDKYQRQYSIKMYVLIHIKIGDEKPYREGHGVVTKTDVERIRKITKALMEDGFRQFFGSSKKEDD